MRAVVVLVLLVALVPHARASAEELRWPDAVDLSVGVADRAQDLMICVVDAGGHAQCHHRGGTLSWVSRGSARAICPGVENALRSPCPGSSTCVFRNVSVPASSFAVLIVALEPPVFGVPRHHVLDSVIFSRSSLPTREPGGERITSAVQALARCVSARAVRPDPAPTVRVVTPAACTDRLCALNQSRIGLTASAREPLVAR